MSGKFTDEELAGLSPEEIAALSDGDGTEDDNLDDIGDDGDDDEDGQNDAGDDKGGNENTSPDVNTEADSDETDDNSTDNKSQAPVSEEIPDLDSLPPVNFIPKLSGELLPAYQAAADKVDEQYEAGDLTLKERDAAIRKLSAESQNEEVAKQAWKAEQVAFFRANPGFSEQTSSVLFDILNQQVIRAANDPANAGLTNLQILYLAKSRVSKAVETLTGIKPVSTVIKDKVIPPKPKTDKVGAKTLANVPVVEMQDTSGDRFAYIDKLTGLDQERALAKLSEADREAYLNEAY